MKKFICFVLIFTMIFLFGCSKDSLNSDSAETESTEFESTLQNTYQNEKTESENTLPADYQNKNVVLPKAIISSYNLAEKFQNIKLDNFTITETIDSMYYGYKSIYSDSGINDKFILINPHSGEETELLRSDNLDNWEVGSGSTVVLQDRYLYEWKSYTSESLENAYDVKLTRIDGKNGNVEIIDELEYATPLIYMCKINDTEFLSYSITQEPSDKTDYAVISAAWIYNINGEKRDIIYEKYENDANWTDSEGILIERFAVKDGELFGLGRRLISGKYQFFLYHYDKNGTLLNEEVLTGFENIIGSEQMLELHLMGDYIAFRTYESLATYICKKTQNGIELVMKGADRQVQYAVSSKYIFFIESNVNVYSGEIEQKDCPLYIIDIANEQICATKFSFPLENPYFVGIQSFSDGSLLITYCENGVYDPLKIKQYILENGIITNETSDLF
ncbi:MAG: hypothetical protein IJZ35_09225 [Clostridia bacterium]|nr:hypothetical protein [Clostridia bacterium]